MSNNRAMDEIDAAWIKERLGTDRGRQTRLAEAIGLESDKLAKVMSGTRKLKPHEIPLVLKFFELDLEIVTAKEKALLKLFRAATDERLAVVEAALAYQPPPRDMP